MYFVTKRLVLAPRADCTMISFVFCNRIPEFSPRGRILLGFPLYFVTKSIFRPAGVFNYDSLRGGVMVVNLNLIVKIRLTFKINSSAKINSRVNLILTIN